MTTAWTSKPMSEILVADPEPTGEATKVAPATPATAAKPEPKPDVLPDKYEGKTVAQVADMHANAEKELGRLRNELGVQSGLVRDLSQLNRTVATETPAVAPQEKVTITGDQLIEDPVGSVQKIIQPAFEAERKRTDAATAESQLGAEAKALETDFGDYSTLVATEAFQEFATRTPSRQQDFVVAATGEGLAQVRAARRLLEDYTDFELQAKKLKDPEAAVTPVQEAAIVATEAGASAATISSKPQIFESDVIALINSDPLKYRSPSYQTELTAAIREGRFVKAN